MLNCKGLLLKFSLLSLCVSTLISCSTFQPIIDVHRHASWPWSDDSVYLQHVMKEKDSSHIVLSLLSTHAKDDLDNWYERQPERFLVGVKVPCPKNTTKPYYHCYPEDAGWVDTSWLRKEIENNRIHLIHEMAFNYFGIRPDDARLDPYWALAAEYDLPVGVHSGRGPGPKGKNTTRSKKGCCPNYDKEMGNPELLRPVLERYPNLRIWLQHFGSGRRDHSYFLEEGLALLKDYPNIYIDLSITNGAMPIEQYAETLKTLIDAGFENRIMFGTDNISPKKILSRFNSLEFLSKKQRNAILYDNAARFLKLDEDTKKAHRKMF